MVDLETLGTLPTSAIVAIGAVAFTNTGQVLGDFERVVDIQSSIDAGCSVTGDTIKWWLNQSNEARAMFQMPSVDLLTALIDFKDWLALYNLDTIKVWGNGASFDNAILAHAYHTQGSPLPWKFWNDRCFRTLAAQSPHIKIQRVGVYHNTLDDAKTQMQHLFKLWGLK